MSGVERVEMARICVIFGILTILSVGFTQGKKPYIRLDAINPDVVVSVGEKLNLRCQQNFNSKTTWYKDDEALHKSTSRIRINKQLLKFKFVEMEDTGVYSCKLESNETIYWRNVTIRVENLQNDGFQNEGEDKSAMNILRSADGDNDLEMETRNLPETRSLHLDSEKLDVDLDEKSESYTEDDHNQKIPESPPSFNKTDEMHTLVVKPAGSMMRLKCPSVGNPRPNITWLKNNEEPKRDIGSVSKTKWTLRLEDLVTKDSGNYTCIVCNYLGCINYTFKVDIIETVPHRPILTIAPRNTTVLIGGNTSMICRVLSDAHRHLEWYHGYHTSLDTVNMTNQSLRVEVKVGTNAEDPEELKLYNVTEKDEGWYTCIAQNTLGETFSSAYLRVVETLDEQKVPLAAKPHILINILAAILCVFFAVGVVVVIYIFHRLKREKMKKLLAIETARAAVVTQWTKKVIVEKQKLVNAQNEEELLMPVVKIEKQKSTVVTDDNTNDNVFEYEIPLDNGWEVPREYLTLGNTLGEGAFGKVVRAEINIGKPGIPNVVAVKMLKEGHTDTDMVDLVSEMEVMKIIGKHVNIINLLGACSQNGPLYVIVEFAPHGNLRDFLREHRPSLGYEPAIGQELKERKTLTQKDLVSFAYQVARGMEYLSSKRCIHRDLAARNVLVSDEYVLKIADFGLARDLHSNDYYRKKTDGRLPVKWMAPEALFHRVYTTQSDVWSYGILLWEIMTLGGTPYPSVPSVEKLFQLLRTGHRMEKPPCCSIEIYMLMRDCWSYQPSERPTFVELVEDLDRILTITANEEYLDLGLPQLDTPPSSQESSETEEEGEEKFPYLL
ncbi:PREDICTED: fibroblast growth factor receptor homolog 1-like isoform X1 [Acromyrmex echinatior]|uniref:fibroblast growth factor receptor homolog 1-like isoform X1 n=1 Tax=Acromyrmex echinatior TaxID=103372 RepID=UPI000580EB30|nr:PREDICTED: fibroblast growth factor receptor homolog 1-like isoform X1 [Acromyrmex echinatior]XP_011056074.1 PREDICTED: fibroblast growth factor receptor homolog 1-like isoform X1 [Acromyrmex echinatior]